MSGHSRKERGDLSNLLHLPAETRGVKHLQRKWEVPRGMQLPESPHRGRPRETQGL